jgi:hypothetical protein
MSESDEHQPDEPHQWGEAVTASSGARVEPGDIIIDPDLALSPEPVVGDDVSTPLEEDEPEGIIPPSPLWAMKDRRHVQWHLLPSHTRHERLRLALGTDDGTIYVIDDGHSHAMVGRRVGASPSGCQYALVGRITMETFEQLQQHTTPLTEAFSDAAEISLCGAVVEERILSSNIFDVARYDGIADVPPAYRPGAPFNQFPDDLEITAY